MVIVLQQEYIEDYKNITISAPAGASKSRKDANINRSFYRFDS
jgi:hypothetical protein